MAILAGAAREMIVRARTASGAGTGAVRLRGVVGRQPRATLVLEYDAVHDDERMLVNPHIYHVMQLFVGMTDRRVMMQ